jgi:hypothetical protein
MMFGMSSRLATVIYNAAQTGTSAGILELNLGLHATMSNMKIVNPLREYEHSYYVVPRQESADGLYAAWREGGGVPPITCCTRRRSVGIQAS